MRAKNKRGSGFTLVEMAVVLVIVGILLSGVTGIAKSWLKLANIKQTKAQIQTVVTTAMSLAAANQALPDKATLSAALLPDQMKDAWGQPIRYAFNGGIDMTNVCSLSSLSSTSPWSVKDCQAASSTTDPSCQTVTDVAFVVMSAGENRSRQVFATFGDSTFKQSPPIATETLPPRGASTAAVTGENALSTSNNGFDDIISAVTLSQLQSQLGCAAINAADALSAANTAAGAAAAGKKICSCTNTKNGKTQNPTGNGGCPAASTPNYCTN